MTEYTDEVEKQRTLMKAEKWGKGIKYIHASNGIIETAFNNGDVHIEENWEGGKSWTIFAQEPKNLMDKYLRWRASSGKR